MRFSKAYITKIVNQIAFVQERIQQNDWVFIAQSFDKTIREAPAGSFIYCDPSYLGRNVTYYDDYCEEQDILLHKLLMKHDGQFMVSSWDHNKYRHNEYLDTIWNDCYKVTTEHTYFIGAKESNRNSTVEALLMNYGSMNN